MALASYLLAGCVDGDPSDSNSMLEELEADQHFVPIRIHDVFDLNEGQASKEYNFSIGPNATSASIRVTLEEQIDGAGVHSYFGCALYGYVVELANGTSEMKPLAEMVCKHWGDDPADVSGTVQIMERDLLKDTGLEDKDFAEILYKVGVDGQATRFVDLVVEIVVEYD